MPLERQQLIRLLFEEYIEMYAARDERLLQRFSDNFSGYTGSGHRLIKRRSDWLDLIRQDFALVPERIGIEMLDKLLKGETVEQWVYTPTGPIYAADVDNYSWF